MKKGYFHGLEVLTSQLFVNPYAHFGQSSIWPNGFPLEHLGMNTDRKYLLSTPSNVPVVQQVLVDGDPDVDAIFKLTRKCRNVTFDKAAPNVIVPHGTYAPFNSKNTLFSYDALWAMVLPVSVHDRVASVMRAYWAQKLLELIGHHVAFLPPNIIHEKTQPFSRSVLNEMTHELHSYFNSREMCEFLRDWTCKHSNDFFQCVRDLTKDLVKAQFFQQNDYELIDVWLADLSSVGYKPPTMVNSQQNVNFNTNHMVVYYPWEKPTCLPHDPLFSISNHISNGDKVFNNITNSACGLYLASRFADDIHHSPKFEDVVLVIEIRDINVIPVLQSFYSFLFPRIVYCGGLDIHAVNSMHRVSYIQTPSSLSCLETVVKMDYNLNSLFLIPETALIKINLKDIDNSKKHLSFYEALQTSKTPRLDISEGILGKFQKQIDKEMENSGLNKCHGPVIHITKDNSLNFLESMNNCKSHPEHCEKLASTEYCDMVNNAKKLDSNNENKINVQIFDFSAINTSEKTQKAYCDLLDSMLK